MTDVETLFRYGHLPAHLQAASKPFYDLATSLAVILAPSDERTLAIQKLWEAKNPKGLKPNPIDLILQAAPVEISHRRE